MSAWHSNPAKWSEQWDTPGRCGLPPTFLGELEGVPESPPSFQPSLRPSQASHASAQQYPPFSAPHGNPPPPKASTRDPDLAKNGFLSGPPSRDLICHVHNQRSHVVRVADPKGQAMERILLWDLGRGRGKRRRGGGKKAALFLGEGEEKGRGLGSCPPASQKRSS